MSKKINKKEIEVGTFVELLEDENYRYIKQEDIKVGKKVYFVSSVWLGIDHSWSKGGKPVIFETMIFERNKTKDSLQDDIYQERYCTEQQAIIGHKKVIRLLKSGKLK